MCHQMHTEGLYLVNATQNLFFQFLVKLRLLKHLCHHFKRPIYRNVAYNKMCSHIDIELEASLLWRSTIPISTDKTSPHFTPPPHPISTPLHSPSPWWAHPTSHPFIKYSESPGARPDAPSLPLSQAGSQPTGHVAYSGVQRAGVQRASWGSKMQSREMLIMFAR